MYDSHETIQITVTMPIAIGFVGNLGFLLVLFRMNHMRTLNNLYLGHLAVADLSFMSAMAVRYIWPFVNSPVDFNVPYQTSLECVVSTFVVYTSVFSSFVFVTLSDSGTIFRDV